MLCAAFPQSDCNQNKGKRLHFTSEVWGTVPIFSCAYRAYCSGTSSSAAAPQRYKSTEIRAHTMSFIIYYNIYELQCLKNGKAMEKSAGLLLECCMGCKQCLTVVPLLSSDARHHSVVPIKAQEYCSHEVGLRIVPQVTTPSKNL